MDASATQAWWEIAKYIGAGATFVMGIVIWRLWPAYQAEIKYSKQRDRETLEIIGALTRVVSETEARASTSHQEVLIAIQRLSDTIHQHLLNKKRHL